jgi:hypothetical protein
MKKLITIVAIIVAIRLLPRAVRREAQFLELMTALCNCLLVTAAATNAKVSTLDKRSADTATALKNARTALSGQNTSSNGLADGTINGSSGNIGLNNGTVGGTSGPQVGGASAHTHGPGSYSVNDGHHVHGPGSYAVTSGNHDHTLPFA